MIEKKAHVTNTKCGRCYHLRQEYLKDEYYCKLQGNHFLKGELVQPDFGDKCKNFKPK